MGSTQDVADVVAIKVVEFLEKRFNRIRQLDEETKRELKDDVAAVVLEEIKDFI